MNMNDTYPLVSVVILSWMRKEELFKTLKELGRLSYPKLEVIVVDNGSTDGSAGMVRNDFPWVRLIPLAENTGIAGFSVGMEEARGKYLVLLDDDSHPQNSAIEKMVKAFEEDPSLGIAAFTIINGRTLKTDWPLEGDVGEDGSSPTFVGCGVGIRSEAAKRAGYFDPDYFLYLNELYLSARIINLGYRVRHLPELVAFHRVAPSHRTTARRIYFNTRNIVKFVRVHLPAGKALFFVLSWLLQGALYQALKTGGQGLGSFLKGFLDGLRPISSKKSVLSAEALRLISPYFSKWYPSPAVTFRQVLWGR